MRTSRRLQRVARCARCCARHGEQRPRLVALVRCMLYKEGTVQAPRRRRVQRRVTEETPAASYRFLCRVTRILLYPIPIPYNPARPPTSSCLSTPTSAPHLKSALTFEHTAAAVDPCTYAVHARLGLGTQSALTFLSALIETLCTLYHIKNSPQDVVHTGCAGHNISYTKLKFWSDTFSDTR